MKKVVITGATGMLGVSLIRRLIASDIEVVCIIKPESLRREAIPKHALVNVIECDSNDLSSVKLNGKYDVFYHFAWKATSHMTRNDPFFQLENVQGTLEAIKLAHQLGCECFIGAGSQAEYGRVSGLIGPDTPANPDLAYGICKYTAGRLGSLLAKELGIRYIWTRVFSVFGPHDGADTMISSCIRKLKNNEEMELTPCEQLWDYLYEDDCAEAFFLLAQKGLDQSIYCIASGSPDILKNYVLEIGRILHKEDLLKFGAQPYQQNQVMSLNVDISSLINDTGFRPQISFVEGIKRIINSL